MDCKQVYRELVARAKTRGRTPTYTERHHIVPRAHGGSNDAANIVRLTAREHFVAHWLLWRIHRDRPMALAFRLLCDGQGRPRSKDYEHAKVLYGSSMMGDANVAKRPEVREKISLALRTKHPHRNKLRPDHAAVMRERGYWSGERNPWFGNGDRQRGSKNPAARGIKGSHPVIGIQQWGTSQAAARDIGVSAQAICQALKRGGSSRGWKLEYTA